MFRNVLTATAIAVMAGTALGADYMFPSANPPAGKTPGQVDQMISFIWDDNGYSGEVGTAYEYKPGEIAWKDRATVGGKDTNGPTKNPENLQEGGMGISWAVKTLGAKLNGGHMTFNMISGLYIPTWGPKWYDRESEYGYYDNGTTADDNGGQVPWKVAVAWGREQKIGTTKGTDNVQKSAMVEGVKKMIAAGHELGNHTIDHIETNSPLPENMWPNGGEGFDDGSSGKDMLGNPFNEAEEFGTEGYALTHGWKGYAGKGLSEQAWNDLVALGEVDGVKQGVHQQGALKAFRAPRLEVNSNMFFALKDRGYVYDCGLEEGYEMTRDGSNFLWPYTTDNGSNNVWTQKEWGETVHIDSMPAGLWQYPVNVMIVPEEIRGAVWENYNRIAQASNDEYIEPKGDWVATGKITGFDFNMFILWGMTGENVTKTLKHTLDLRMDGNGNRAPMHIGCHTDYFTPIYDNATLMADFNKSTYGLVISEGWNDYKARKKSFEDFADYARGKGAKFMSGIEVIEKIKEYQRDEVFGEEKSYSGMGWKLSTEDANSSGPESVSGDLKANVTVGSSDAYVVYETFQSAGFYEGMTHISLDYKTTTPLALILYVENDSPWEVLLNNVNYDAKSGKIPLSAFHYNQYDTEGKNTKLDPAKITGVAIRPMIETKTSKEVSIDVRNIKLYGAAMTGGTAIGDATFNKGSFVKMNTITKNNLMLEVGTPGTYSIDIFSANGRIVRSITKEMSSTTANVPLNNLSSGVYMMKISNGQKTQMLKAMVM